MTSKGSEGTLPLEFTFDFNASGKSTIRFPVEGGGLPPLSQVRSRLYSLRVTKYAPNNCREISFYLNSLDHICY